MLEWKIRSGRFGSLHVGTRTGKEYAHAVETANGACYYQFRGLQDADLESDSAKRADSLEMAKKICEGMMSAWAHEAQ